TPIARHAGPPERGRGDQEEARVVGPLCRTGGAHAVRRTATGALPGPQRAHRREVLTMADQAAHRKLTFQILRYNPQDPSSTPRMQRYELEEADSMTLFIALNTIRGQQ